MFMLTWSKWGGHLIYPKLEFVEERYFTVFEVLNENFQNSQVGIGGIELDATPSDSIWYLVSQSNTDYRPNITVGGGDTLAVSWNTETSLVQPTDEAFMRIFTIEALTTDIDSQYEPIKLQLSQSYPNPFNYSTIISFSLKEKSHINLSIYNLKGQLIKTLFDEEIKPIKDFTITWDGKDDNGKDVSPGIYLYQLSVPNRKSITRKMILLK